MTHAKDIHCPHFILCSGCTIDENVNHPPLLQEVRRYFQESSTPFEYFSDQVKGWRCRAKLAVRGRCENPQIGLFEAGTHHVVDIPYCRVHHPSINQAMEQIKDWIRSEKIAPYDEMNLKGLLRYMQCVVERSTGRVQLTLVLNCADYSGLLPALNSLWVQAPGLWHSLWLNINTQRTNSIFGKDWILIKGEEYVWETLAGAKVCFHPANFAQANLDVFERLLLDLKDLIQLHQRFVEYYAGVGVIGLCLAEKAQRVLACEINPFAAASFEKAYALQNSTPMTLFTGPAVNYLNLLNKADVVIADPPRKGLDGPLLKALLENSNVKEFWYVSCGWPSFKRDTQELLKRWHLKQAKAYLFFPGTDHLEILAQFVRS
jgi:23S rRNA (uracil1939-C5)-methyltransferase